MALTGKAFLYGRRLIEGETLRDYKGTEWVFHAIVHGRVYVKSKNDPEHILFREFYVTLFPGLVVEDEEDD